MWPTWLFFILLLFLTLLFLLTFAFFYYILLLTLSLNAAFSFINLYFNTVHNILVHSAVLNYESCF